MTASSASGKIILFGEHAVVYGRPALAVPVNQLFVKVDISDSSRAGIRIDAPDINLHAEHSSLPSDHPLASVINRVFSLLNIFPFPPLTIHISSTIPVASGLGSGAAVTVALARALSAHLGQPLDDAQVNALAFEIEKLHHGSPSGIDNTVITYNKPVYFIKNELTETFNVGAPFTMVIGDTGIAAPTKESVNDVRRLHDKNPARLESVFDEIAQIVVVARRAIESGRTDMLGELMDQNHAFLQELTVSSPELDRLVTAARKAGALGAKLSGGGRGGNMIALVNDGTTDSVVKSLKDAGAKNVFITRVA